MTKLKVVKTKKINKNEAYAEVEIDGKLYTDRFSISGKKASIKKMDSDSLQYKIANAMLNAIQSKSKKEDENGNSEVNSG